MKAFSYIKVVHLHPDNSSKRQRQGSRYLTIAKAMDDNNNVIAKGIAKCCVEDQPNRKMGYELAVGRCYKELCKQPA